MSLICLRIISWEVLAYKVKGPWNMTSRDLHVYLEALDLGSPLRSNLKDVELVRCPCRMIAAWVCFGSEKRRNTGFDLVKIYQQLIQRSSIKLLQNSLEQGLSCLTFASLLAPKYHTTVWNLLRSCSGVLPDRSSSVIGNRYRRQDSLVIRALQAAKLSLDR